MITAISSQQSREIENLISDLLVRAEAEAVFLCDKGGYIISQASVQEYEKNDNIAALSSGSFFATREIARLIGEPEFRSVFHQGDQKSIYMRSTSADLLLVIVFNNNSSPGLVKLCADDACNILEESLVSSDRADQAWADATTEIKLNLSDGAALFERAGSINPESIPNSRL